MCYNIIGGSMINKKWDIVLKEEFEKEYFKKLGIFV
jgi:hypothetical protein